MLPTLIAKAPKLYNELASGINTNLDLDEAIKLALFAQNVKEEDIQNGVIGKESTIFGRSADNLSILIPIPDKIHLIRDQIFASSSGLSPETPGNDHQRMQAENASLAIYNGTQSANLATHTGEYLSGLGVNVLQTNEDGDTQTSTKIFCTDVFPQGLFRLAFLRLEQVHDVLIDDALSLAQINGFLMHSVL